MWFRKSDSKMPPAATTGTQVDTGRWVSESTEGPLSEGESFASVKHASGMTVHKGGGQCDLQDLRDLFTNLDALVAREDEKARRLKVVK